MTTTTTKGAVVPPSSGSTKSTIPSSSTSSNANNNGNPTGGGGGFKSLFVGGASATTTTTTASSGNNSGARSSAPVGSSSSAASASQGVQSVGSSIASSTFAAATPLKAAASKMAANMRATLQPLGLPGGGGGHSSSLSAGQQQHQQQHVEKSEFLDSKPWYRSPKNGGGGGGSQRSAATSTSTGTSSSSNNNNNTTTTTTTASRGGAMNNDNSRRGIEPLLVGPEDDDDEEDEELNRMPTEKYLDLYKHQPWILSHNLTSVTRNPLANPASQANVGESAVSRMFSSLSSSTTKKKRPSAATSAAAVLRLQEEEGGDMDDARSVSSHYTANSSSTLQKPSTILPAVLAPVSLADFAPFFERTRTRTERFFKTHKDSDFVVVSKSSSQQPKLKPGENPKISKFNVRAGSAVSELPEDPVAQLAKCYSTIPPHFFSSNYVAASSVEVTALIESADEAMRRQRGRSGSSVDESTFHNNNANSTVEAAIQGLKEDISNRLSDQMDLVEKSLWVQTTSKAEAIFQTVANLNALQAMVAVEGRRVATIRAHVSALRHATTHGRSNVLILQRKRTNASSLMKTMETLKRVLNSKAALEKMMASHDYTGAFGAIETAQYMLDSPELTGISALKTVSRQLREMKDLIGGEMAERFVKVATQAFDEAGNFLGDESEEGDRKLKASLEPLVRGLMRKGNLKDALASNRARLLDLVKLTAKAVVTETLIKVPESERSSALKNMEIDAFVAFLKATFDALETIQNRSKVVHSAVVETLQKIVGGARAGGGQSVTKEEIKDAINVSSHVVLKIREATQQIAIRLLSFRDELHARLSMEDFAKVWEAVQEFISASGEPSTDLRVALTKQADMFLIRLDETLVARVKAGFDADNWEPVFPVPNDVVNIVAKIEANSISSVLSDARPGGDAFFDSVVSSTSNSGSNATNSVNPSGNSGGARKVTVGTRQYKTTATGCVMIRNMQEYARCALSFTPVAPRAAARCFDAIVNFHETTKRLILGAEVKRTGKLQTIGAKHLALAWQSLSLVLGLLPNLGKIFAEVVPSQQRTRVEEERTRVHEALTAHSFQIINMLASLIKNELNASCGALDKDVDWDRRGTEDLDKPQKYMSDLIEKVGKLHQVISMHLDKEDVSSVFERVFIIINQRIPELFQVVRPKTPAGKTRVRVDIINLVSSLRMLRGLQCTPGEALEQWLESKYGAAASLPPPVPNTVPPPGLPPSEATPPEPASSSS